MCNSILAHAIDLTFLELEPFSKREALNWLVNKANETISGKKINLSIRHIARIWNWHKSKVERFIKVLKEKTVIETANEEGKTRISICNLRYWQNDKCDTETITETVIETKADLNDQKVAGRDTSEIHIESSKHQQLPCLQQSFLDKAETDSRQKQDGFKIKKKKEKKQKKEKEESLKEKSIPYRDTKKEKVHDEIDSFPSTHFNEVIDFAASIAIAPHEVELEIAKFKDHLKCGYKKLPKDMLAAFRNWLRRSLEFNRFKGRNGQINQTKSAPNSFERFLIAGARAVAELERDGLDGRYAGQEPIFVSAGTCDKQEFCYLQPAN